MSAFTVWEVPEWTLQYIMKPILFIWCFGGLFEDWFYKAMKLATRGCITEKLFRVTEFFEKWIFWTVHKYCFLFFFFLYGINHVSVYMILQCGSLLFWLLDVFLQSNHLCLWFILFRHQQDLCQVIFRDQIMLIIH